MSDSKETGLSNLLNTRPTSDSNGGYSRVSIFSVFPLQFEEKDSIVKALASDAENLV